MGTLFAGRAGGALFASRTGVVQAFAHPAALTIDDLTTPHAHRARRDVPDRILGDQGEGRAEKRDARRELLVVAGAQAEEESARREDRRRDGVDLPDANGEMAVRELDDPRFGVELLRPSVDG